MTDALAMSRSVYKRLAAMAGEPAVAMRAWNGDVWGPEDARATIVLNHPGALRALLLPPNELTVGEAYIYDDVDIEGSIHEVVRFVARLRSTRGRRLASLRLFRQLRKLPAENRRSTHLRPERAGRLHSKKRDKASVTAHYDTGNDFFRQFLDPGMVYSSGVFLDPDEPLEKAQQRKIDLICRKLQLRPGQRLLDIGCGWGTLAIHAARHYDVDVTGVTLSRPQVALATAAADDAGVGDRVTFEVLDYRDVKGRFDAIASVGMFEHVGKGQLARYFDKIRDMLEPGGTFLNHGIVIRDRLARRVKPDFIDTYVFPDSDLVTVDEVIGLAEDAGFELRDAESLRTSYALTLQHWVNNLETNRKAAVAATDETTYRIWRIYMAGAAVAFDVGAVSVYQLLLDTTDRPWTFGRSHLLATDDQ
ncbi:MAG: class I SAM-dependent methyltransferase [Acidobacteria bacterium]|nr:class I SAM-dependent methyltransferase [Acidobacteriota bacterium]